MADSKFQTLNFPKLITEYKQNNFKKMAILHHEFVYACFHPTMDDCVIALEKNYYPNESELYTLVPEGGSFYSRLITHLEGLKDLDKLRKLSQLLGIDKKVLTVVTEEQDKRAEDTPAALKNNLQSNPVPQSSERSAYSEHSNSEIQIEINSPRDGGLFNQRQDEKQAAGEQLNLSNDEIPNNKEAIQDAIKFEILKRMKQNSNTPNQPSVGGKSINQIVTQGFRPLLMKHLTNAHPVAVTTKEDTVVPSDQTVLSPLKTKKHSQFVQNNYQTMGGGEENTQEFAFQEPVSLKEERLESTGKKKYGISIWRLNRGQQAFQINEHPFNLFPVGSRFFISHDSKYIIIFLMNDQGGSDQVDRVRLLDMQTLELIDEINMHRFYPIFSQDLVEANLVWNSQYLYIQTKEMACFLNVNKRKLEYEFELINEDHTNQIKTLKHAIFKENEPMVFFSIVQTIKTGQCTDQESYSLHRTNIEKSNDVFESKNFFMAITQNSSLEYNGTIGYNKHLSQIIFPGEQVFYAFSLRLKALKPYRHVQNCQVNKNSYLRDYIWLAYNDDNYDTFTISSQNFSHKYPLSDIDLDDFRLGDIMKEKNQALDEQCIFAIGKKGEKEASSRIMINVTQPDGTEPFINYIQETSDYVFAYPFILYCKGNTELFIQSLHAPEKLIKLDLEDQFVCFCEMNHFVRLKPLHIALGLSDGNQQFRQYESIAFLTQNEDQIFLNIVEYTPFGFEKQYTFYKSVKSIQRPKSTIILLICQLHSEISLKHRSKRLNIESVKIMTMFWYFSIEIISSSGHFLTSLSSILTNVRFFPHNLIVFYRFPMICIPSTDKNLPDTCFFVSKDGYSSKIERIGFNGKEFKDPLSTAYELKTQNLFIFTYHDGYFYFMDDTLSLKQLVYDNRTQKLKFIKMFEFAQEYKDMLAQQVDFEEIQVTSKGVYRGTHFMPFHDNTIYNKDINFIKTDPVLSIPDNDLFAGPKKASGTQYMLYIARGDQGILQGDDFNSFENQVEDLNDLESDEQSDDNVQDSMVTDKHNVPFSSPNTKSNFEQPESVNYATSTQNLKQSLFGSVVEPTKPPVIKELKSPYNKSKSSHRPSKSISNQQSDGFFAFKSSKTLKRTSSPEVSPRNNEAHGFQSKKTILKKSVQDEGEEPRDSEDNPLYTRRRTSMALLDNNVNIAHEQVYAWIVPFLDSNVVHLMHNIKENNNPKYQITFSTFLNSQNEILCQINSVFYIFSKNGTLLYQVKALKDEDKDAHYFQKNKLTLETMSINLNYFLFYNQECKYFEVFKLTRDKVDDQSLKQKLTRQKYTRMKTKTMKTNLQGGLSALVNRQVNNSVPQVYTLQFVKRVLDFNQFPVKNDYFNQRTVSNYGEVYQMVQVKLPEKLQDLQRPGGKSLVEISENKRRSGIININGPILELKVEETEEKKKKVEGECVFEFYIDDRNVGEDIRTKFKLIKEHRKTQITPSEELKIFGYQIIDDYLFIKRQWKLEYLKIFNTDPKTKQQTYMGDKINSKAQYVHLMLDKNSEIQRLMTTASTTPELVQIVLVDERFIYVVTWDINKNIEHQMMQMQKTIKFNAGHIICKGMTERHNYIPIENQFFDLFYGLPFKFFTGFGKKVPKNAKMNMNERKFSYYNKEYLDLYEGNKVFKSYTYLELCYFKALSQMNVDQIDSTHIFSQYMNIRIQGYTIFGLIGLNSNLLKDIGEEIRKHDEQLMSTNNSHQEMSAQCMKMVYLHILYPDFQNISAFDIVMAKKSPKSIETMLEMLSTLPNYSLSKYFMHHFSDLFRMELVAFQNFLQCCLFQTPQMKEIKVIKWVHNRDEYLVDYHTSYLGQTFYKQIQKRSFTSFWRRKTLNLEEFEKEEPESPERVASDGFESLPTLRDEQQNIIQGITEDAMVNYGRDKMDWKGTNVQEELTRVETCAVEFDWIFRGNNAIMFIEHLAHRADESIFGVDLIRIIVLFLWGRFFYHIRNKIFIPFLAYFLIFIFEITYLFEHRVYIDEVREGLEDSNQVFTEQQERAWFIGNFVIVGMLAAFWVYFVFIEIRQCIKLGQEYFRELWNWLDMVSLSLNCAYFILVYNQVGAHKIRVLSSCAILLMWLKLLYFLRLFSHTASLIRMIVQILNDMRIYTVIYFMVLVGFANALYILAYNLDPADQAALFNNNPFNAIIYTFRAGLGDFNTDPFDSSEDRPLWYFLWLAQVMLIQVVLLNLLIAIMADTFDMVKQKQEESKLREICEMMSDYEGFVDRESEFKHSKYIIVTTLEKAQTNVTQDWEGKIIAMKNTFQSIARDLKKDSKNMNEALRDEIIGNNKAMDQKFSDMQSLIMKQNSQISLALKKMEKLGESMKRIKTQPTDVEGRDHDGLVIEVVDMSEKPQEGLANFNSHVINNQMTFYPGNKNELHVKEIVVTDETHRVMNSEQKR